MVPLLQRGRALARSTRAALRRRRDVLPALRKRLLAAVPGGEAAPVRLERIRLRTLFTLVATVVAVYLLAGELARASLGHVLRSADWRWGIVALGLSALTYVGATLSLSGFVAERLSFVRTILAQLAGSFVTLVTPGRGRRRGPQHSLPAAQEGPGRRSRRPASACSQVVAFVLHILLLVMFIALAGAADKEPFRPPTWSYFVLAGLVVVGPGRAGGARRAAAAARPGGAPLGQVLPRLLEVAQQPRKLAEGIGGALLLSLATSCCLAACVRPSAARRPSRALPWST